MKRKNRFFAFVLAVCMAVSLMACHGSDSAETGAVETGDSSTDEALDEDIQDSESAGTENIRSGPYPSDEFARAAWYGFFPEELAALEKDSPVTWKQTCDLLGQMINVWDAERYGAWQEKTASAPDTQISWSGAMLALFEAAELLNVTDANAQSNVNYDYMNATPTPLFEPDTVVQMGGTFDGRECPKQTAALYYTARRVSCVSGHELIEAPQPQVDLSTPLELETAVCAAVRLYESVPEHLPDIDIIDTAESSAWEAAFLESADQRIAEIINNPENIIPEDARTIYYVSNSGNDANDGRAPERAWATLDKINQSYLQPGDVVCFERGGLWRGKLTPPPSITFTTYGEGPKPIITCSPANGSGAENWVLYGQSSDGGQIWKYAHEISDTGGIVLGDTGTIAKRVFAWYDGKSFYNTWDKQVPFVLENELLWDLSFYCDIAYPEHELPFQVMPYADKATIYLRCDAGNPGEIYDSIEFMSTQVNELPYANIHLSEGSALYNLSIQNFAGRAVMLRRGCTVKYCDIGFGSSALDVFYQPDVQCGIWTDASAIFFQASDVTVSDNYIHDVDCHAVTMELGGEIETMRAEAPYQNIEIKDNVIARCDYGIYWANNQVETWEWEIFGPSEISGNYVMESGRGWYADRLSNMDSAAQVQMSRIALNFGANPGIGIQNVKVEDNVFYKADLHLVTYAWPGNGEPYFHGNTYAQDVGHGLIHTLSPNVMAYDVESAKEYIAEQYQEKDFEVYLLK